MFDLLIHGGTVIDGTGASARRADVGIRGDRIAAIGDLAPAAARVSVDASGQHVCPGFIDVHSHSDTYLLIEPNAASKLHQGVTTEIVGNCGASAAPLAGAYRLPSDWSDKTYPGAWRSVAEYRALLEQQHPAINVFFMIGHNTLRAGIVGYENRPATGDELCRMERALEQGLAEGARGFSSGLAYTPGIFAPESELHRLGKVVAAAGGIYTSHMRSESDRLVEAVTETISVGRTSGIRVQISHLKSVGKANWGLLDRAIDVIEQARAEGVRVAADRYPYTCSCTDLDIIFPDWAEEGGREAVLRRLRHPAERRRIREDLLRARADDYWDTVTIGSTSHPDNLPFRGMTLRDVAARLGMEPVDAVLHLTDTDDLRTSAFFFGMSEANMLKVLTRPYVMIGSDGSLRAPTGQLSQDHPHPRAYGSFPRFLQLVLEGRAPIRIEEAIYKMTGLAAEQFELNGRGVLTPGHFADVIVLDLPRFRDRSTFAQPHQFSEGVSHVIVNGRHTLRDANLTDQRAGQWL